MEMFDESIDVLCVDFSWSPRQPRRTQVPLTTKALWLVVSCHGDSPTSNSSSKTRGAAAPRTRITWASFLDLEEPSLKLSRSAKLQRTNSSSISNCRRLKSAIFISRNINYNRNSLLLLRVGTRIIYIYIYLYIYLSIYRTSVTYQKSK